MSTKATLYLDSRMYKAFKMRAVETGQPISTLMNEALQAQLSEDAADIKAIRNRRSKNETPLSYETALKQLQKDGII